MRPQNKHQRVMLSKNPSGQVEYCETCNVVELALGAVSVRVHAEDLDYLAQLLQQAQSNMHTYHAEKSRFENEMLRVGELH